jgi:hypothetical protein
MRAFLLAMMILIPSNGLLAQDDWIELKPIDDDSIKVEDETGTPKTLQDLPKKFTYQGKVQYLGPVGFIYLGDYYFIDDLNPEMAALAWRHGAETWPWAGPVTDRLSLLAVHEGNWLEAARGLMLDYREDLPPRGHVDWALSGDIPLTSEDIQDISQPPTILFRQALQSLRQIPVDDALRTPRIFLEGRLQTLAGLERGALLSFQKIPLSDLELPWSDQAALMRGHLYFGSFNPERALMEYQSILDRHSELGGRIEEIRAGFDRPEGLGEGKLMDISTKLVGKTAEGRWAITAPEWDLWPVEEIRGPGEGKAHARVIFRSDDYWVISLPLGADESGWERGKTIILSGYPAKGN